MTDYDVVVVGAGILGVASAYHIKRSHPEKEVLVLDRYGAPGQGNTGRSNAMFRNTFSSSDNQILADSSIEFYLHIQSALKEDIGLQQIGYLWLMSEAQFSESEPFLRKMTDNRIETKLLDLPQLKEHLLGLVTAFGSSDEAEMMNLPQVRAGIFGPKCGRLDPDKLTRFYSQKFAQLGGKFAFNTNAESLIVGPTKRLGAEGEPFVWQESEIEGVEVKGSINGVIRAKTIVLACGAWGNELLGPIGVDGHVKAKKRQIFSVDATDRRDLEGLVHTKGFNDLGLLPLVILPKSGVHFKPVSDENAIWVACEDEVNRPYIDIPEHDLDKYRAEPLYWERSVKPVLSAYFPAFKESRIKAMWAGLYSYNTLDYLPFAFRDRNLIVVGGDSGSGIMKGDSLGRVVSGIYSEEEEVELYGGVSYSASRIGFVRRQAERERWVI